MVRLALISDTHLSARLGFFHANVARTIAAVNALAPDFVVNCGDLTIDGADSEEDLRFAVHVHRDLAAPCALIPGNHDVGEEPHAIHCDQPIDAARLARYRAVVGDDWWARDVAGWRFIGINTMLFGSGLEDETRQAHWLIDELGGARGRPIGVFSHKPLWLDGVAEIPSPEWTLAPALRREVAALFADARVSFIASGHLHQARARLDGGALHVWTPSCAFPGTHALGGDPALGFAMLDLREDGTAAARFVAPEGLNPRTLAEIKAPSGAAFLKDCPAAPVSVDWR